MSNKRRKWIQVSLNSSNKGRSYSWISNLWIVVNHRPRSLITINKVPSTHPWVRVNINKKWNEFLVPTNSTMISHLIMINSFKIKLNLLSSHQNCFSKRVTVRELKRDKLRNNESNKWRGGILKQITLNWSIDTYLISLPFPEPHSQW